MKILLINNNPVVSRLTALSARKEDIEIDEIQEVTELSSASYDIVFVDAESWSKDVSDVIAGNIKTKKTVLFYVEGDEEEKDAFDLSILKPFLPSEVSAVIRSVEAIEEIDDLDEENNLNMLDEKKELEETDLFDLDLLDEPKEVEVKKEIKKEEVASVLNDKMDLDLEELSFDDKLEEAFPLTSNSLDDDLFDNSEKLDLDLDFKEEIKEDIKEEITLDAKEDTLESDLFDLDLSDEKKEESKELFKEEALVSLEDSPLELDENIEVDSPKSETKILDHSEIENIKGILSEDTDNDMTLEDLMPPLAIMPSVETKNEPQEEKEVKEMKSEVEELEVIKTKEDKKTKKVKEEADESSDELDVDSNILSQALASMPVDNLRELLAGSKINIKIKFPKSKK